MIIKNSQFSLASDLYQPPSSLAYSRFLTFNCAIQSGLLSTLLFSILLASFITPSIRSHDVEKSRGVQISASFPPRQRNHSQLYLLDVTAVTLCLEIKF